MDFVRIGKKLISREKIYKKVEEIVKLRSEGNSQIETANILGLDRTFISRLENIGEVRKGGKIALIGFPVKNKKELEEVAAEEGVDFVFLLTERERMSFVEEKTGIQLLDSLMRIIRELRDYDTVIILGSDERIRIVEGILDKEVIALELGKSPLKEDVYVNKEDLRKIIISLK
ncbi:MAG: transcriptional regulator [Firmicutes bacterium HGW-Firmicutes-13]|nr:MAG: transcriptional regulator [Firmicutes bacterium HGW-Firmicutes-13]